jgi:hypothetical protein
MLTSSGTEVISAIVTPAILILATSSLISATASRQSKILERVRSLSDDIEMPTGLAEGKRKFLLTQILKATTRTRLIQRALLCLYLSLGALILTSVAVGVSSVAGMGNAKVILVAIFASLSLLFYSSVLLIRESRIALSAVDAEMDYVRKLA